MKNKKYGILVIDPPWEYSSKNTGGSMKSGASSKYPTMSLDELKSLPITQLCDQVNGSLVIVWATTPLLPEAFELIKAWGLNYKTAITWIKTGRIGTGHWFRVNTEHALLCTYGNPPPLYSPLRNYVEARPTQHSAKPDEFYNLIEATINDTELRNVKKLDIFARKKRKGWTSIGYEVDGVDIRAHLHKVSGTMPLEQWSLHQ